MRNLYISLITFNGHLKGATFMHFKLWHSKLFSKFSYLLSYWIRKRSQTLQILDWLLIDIVDSIDHILAYLVLFHEMLDTALELSQHSFHFSTHGLDLFVHLRYYRVHWRFQEVQAFQNFSCYREHMGMTVYLIRKFVLAWFITALEYWFECDDAPLLFQDTGGSFLTFGSTILWIL